jgi:hypothetical protein
MNQPADESTHAPAHGHAPAHTDSQAHPDANPHDSVEQVIHLVPFVLPLVGGVLMFLLAFIAVYMA